MKSQGVPGWVFAVAAMAILQFAAALTTQMYPIVGPAGAGWLRLVGGAIFSLLLCAPTFGRTVYRTFASSSGWGS